MSKEIQDFIAATAAVSSLLALIVSIGAAALAAYFGPYLKKKAESRAKDEGFDHYLEQLVRETRSLESIRSELGTAAALRVETRKSALAGDSADRTERLKGELTQNVERMKGELQAQIGHLTQVFTPRLEAYRTLWAMTSTVRFAGAAAITPGARQGLADAMTDWYYADGNGLFLSAAATEKWLAARDLLISPAADAEVQAIFSTLRGQLKDDIGVYGPALKHRPGGADAVSSAASDV